MSPCGHSQKILVMTWLNLTAVVNASSSTASSSSSHNIHRQNMYQETMESTSFRNYGSRLAQLHYANWKTNRRQMQKASNKRKLEGDDDELFFDSNGMPIQHDDDDDIGEIQASAETEETASSQGHKSDNETEVEPDMDLEESQSRNGDDRNAPMKNQSSINNELFYNTHDRYSPDEQPADTIFDDILRGFSFASLFCICLICLYKLCRYSCIRCGFLPDDRLVEARWKLYQLKHKRAYKHGPTSMDARSLGKWFDQRDKMLPDGGIWDSSAVRSVGSWDDESSGGLDFDEGLQMSHWDKDDASDVTELEYGEGDELEDKSHDERLFDVEDGGAALKKQAKKFFDGTKKLLVNKIHQNKDSITTSKDSDTNQSSCEVGTKNIVSDNAFFEALKPPSSSPGADELSTAASNDIQNGTAPHFPQQQTDPVIPSDNTTQSRANDCDGNEEFNENMLLDDRGYDVESDLLGLRSDSPPPLDLEEIEKKMLENMENAKSYY